jgi:beta-glucosidase
VTIQQGLENAGFEVNPDLTDFYQENAVAAIEYKNVGTDFNLYENPASDLEALMDDAKNYSDVAIYVLSRLGGEGDDLPMDMDGMVGGEAGKSYLELNQDERDTIDLLKENFGTLVVIVNSPNTMELGFLDEEGVDAAISIGCPGSTGCNAVGEVLAGVVNPSGRTTDTFAYSVKSAPSYYTMGGHDYTNVTFQNTSMFAGTGDAANEAEGDSYHFIEYVEGIYVGYRYYETAAADGYIDYDSTVQFPFGYGLSYTSFEETISGFNADGTTVSVDVTVENSGAASGKDVVEIYYSAPYTPGGIEKSSVVLAGFAKTDLLEPGEKQTVNISFTYEDMASYDYSGVKADGGAYVLEAGEYQISLQSDSHNVIDSRSMTVEKDVIYNDANDGKRSSDDVAAVNLFDDVSFGDSLTYVSRADWAGTMPTTATPAEKEATSDQVAALTDTEIVLEDSTPATVKTVNHHLKLADMEGLDYDDPQWDQLIEQISLKEMTLLVGNGGWNVMAVKSVDKPAATDCDGPNGINNLLCGEQGNPYTNQATLAATWNTELAYEKGQVYGQEAEAYGISGIYGPAVNIHRSPFSGRNYEYYSEDGLLSGKFAAAEICGINESNVYCYLKHFALNDQEKNRDEGGLVTWANEQAMREIYLKGFELGVKEGGTYGIMSSFNRIGTTPTAESSPLLNSVLRDEWGFCGAVITDCVMSCYTQDINRSVLAGNDMQLNLLAQNMMSSELTGTVSGIAALRSATKNILYMTVNSGALSVAHSGLYSFEYPLIIADIVILALFALYFFRRHKKLKRWKAWKAENAAIVVEGEK